MSWVYYKEKENRKDRIDWNRYFLDNLKGELDEETARKTLGKFLHHNLRFTTELMMGFILKPFQTILIKGWFEKAFSLAVWSRGAGKCLIYSNESKIITKKEGLIGLKDLFPNLDINEERWIDIPEMEIWNGEEWQKISKILIQPNKECAKITTRNGYNLSGSINHRIKIFDTETGEIIWKKYNELKENNYVCISRNEVPIENDYITEQDEKEAYFIGLLVGDGCYAESRKWQARLSTADKEIFDFVNNNFKIAKIYKKENNKASDLNFNKSYIKPLLDKYEIKQSLSYDKIIPKKILKSKILLKNFLSGLFDTDGTAYRNRIKYCTTSKELANQVHLSLLNFGIISSIKEKKTKSNFGKCYLVCISGEDVFIFKNKIGFKLSRKQEKIIEKKWNTNINIVPNIKNLIRLIKSNIRVKRGSSLWKGSLKNFTSCKNISYRKLNKYISYFDNANYNDENLQLLKNIQKENFFFDPIIKIEKFNYNCIDFNVPNGKKYWSNGFISHNTSLIGIFAALYCIFNPNTKIVIVSNNFRSSRKILEEIDNLSRKKSGFLLKQVLDGDLSRRNDVFTLKFKNSSSIEALPLATGETLRGRRANVLIIDEARSVSKSIVENVLKPFLIASADITMKFKIREIEDRLIKKGIMKEGDRRIFDSTSKMIMLSSASFQAEYLYEVYTNYKKLIEIEGSTDHFISQLSYEVLEQLAPEILDKGMVADIKNGNIPKHTIEREYKAHFVNDSEGFYRAKKLLECSIKDGEEPTVEIKGDSNAEYILGIDPNVSGSEYADHFAMSLLKIIKKKDDKKIGMLVHSYGAAGVDLKDHINYFLYILKNFNVVYIAIDATQGDNIDFINICNESEIFKNAKINLLPIEAEFGKEDQSDIARQVKMKYNLNQNKIVQKQVFHSSFQGAAHDYLQSCVDFGNVIFAGKASALPNKPELMSQQNIGNIYKIHSLFNDSPDGNPLYDFIQYQDYLLDLTRNEMTMIQVSVSSLGTRSFDIPTSLKIMKSSNRLRKDNVSSLMLANWALNIFLQSRELPNQERNTTFAPMLI